MKAVVLVGGEGTRLRPLTYTTPKPMLPVCNRPFVEHQLEWLASHGVDEVVLSMGYLPQAFQQHFVGNTFDSARGPLRVRYAVEDQPLGTAGAIRYASEGFTERFVVCNGDVLTDLDLTAMVATHVHNSAEASISLTQVDDPSRFGVVPTSDDGRVLAFIEKPPPGRATTNWINAGTYILEASMLDRIPRGVNVSIEKATFPRMLEQGGRLFAVQSSAYWLDMGVPQQYMRANHDLLAGLLHRPPHPAAIEVSAGIWRLGDVTIDPSARVLAPALLGPGSRVGAGATVRRSVLGAEVVIEAGAELFDSVVLDAASVGAGAVVDDAILGRGSVIERGAAVSGGSVIGDAAVVAAGSRLVGTKFDPPDLELATPIA